jgi:hypothetical protein
MNVIGGNLTDFAATLTGFRHISRAEGSFDSVTGVTSNNPYSLQLNTGFFQTKMCAGATGPYREDCRGWVQFVFRSSGFAFIEYWLLNYGPPGAICPTPRGANCQPGYASTDGWCPSQNYPTGLVNCVVNSTPLPASPHPMTALGQLKLAGNPTLSSGPLGPVTEALIVSESGIPLSLRGDNYLPDLADQWNEVEFNVFGQGGGSQAVFNSGAKLVVRTEVIPHGGADTGPGCHLTSFTLESNNLTLDNSPPVSPARQPTPALVFSESNPAATGPAADCKSTVSLDGYDHFAVTGALVPTVFSGKSDGPPPPVIEETVLDSRALTGIIWQEQGDDPCYLRLYYKDLTSPDGPTYREFPGCSVNGGRGHDRSQLAPSMPRGYFVTGLAVVLNKNRDKVKGIWIKGSPAACLAGVSSATIPGTPPQTLDCRSGLPTKEDAKEHWNAIGSHTNQYDSDWERQVFCPAGTVATGIAVNVEGGFGNKKVYSGLALRCRSILALPFLLQ